MLQGVQRQVWGRAGTRARTHPPEVATDPPSTGDGGGICPVPGCWTDCEQRRHHRVSLEQTIAPPPPRVQWTRSGSQRSPDELATPEHAFWVHRPRPLPRHGPGRPTLGRLRRRHRVESVHVRRRGGAASSPADGWLQPVKSQVELRREGRGTPAEGGAELRHCAHICQGKNCMLASPGVSSATAESSRGPRMHASLLGAHELQSGAGGPSQNGNAPQTNALHACETGSLTGRSVAQTGVETGAWAPGHRAKSPAKHTNHAAASARAIRSPQRSF